MTTPVDHLKAAIEGGRTDIVRSIISAYERDEIADHDDFTLDKLLTSSVPNAGTLLHLAAKLDQADCVRALLSAGADPCTLNSDQHSPLDLSTSQRVRDVFHHELLQSVAHSNVERVCRLLDAGVSVSMLDSEVSRNTPLHWAASYATPHLVQLLCERGAGVNEPNAAGVTPLHEAVGRGDGDVTDELLRQGADPNATAVSGKFAGKSSIDLAEGHLHLAAIMAKYIDGVSLENGEIGSETAAQTDAVLNGQSVDDCSESATQISNIPTQTTADVDTGSEISEVADPILDLLWPKPIRLILKEGSDTFQPHGTLHVFIAAQTGEVSEMLSLWQRHGDRFAAVGLSVAMETLAGVPACMPCVLCQLNSHMCPQPHSYQLSVTPGMVKLLAGDLPGLYYGVGALVQLLQLYAPLGVPSLQIHDRPCLHKRGVLLDFSKGRIPTMDHMKNLIKKLSFLRINQVELYFRFDVSPQVRSEWQFPYSRSELLELSRFCWLHFVLLLPVVDVCPEVSLSDMPSLQGPIGLFLDCFPSLPAVPVGPRLSAFLLDSGEVVSDIGQLLPVCHHVGLQLCAVSLPADRLDSLSVNVTLAEYGVQADYDWAENCKKYMEAGVPFTVVPGTAAWSSLAGCPEAAVANISSAAHQAVIHGALGLVVSHWSGAGHMTHQSFMWPGLLVAAGLAWNSDVSLPFIHTTLAELLNRHVFDDAASIVGQVVIELGRAETYLLKSSCQQAGGTGCPLPAPDGTTLHRLLSCADKVDLESLKTDSFQKTMRHIRKCQAELGRERLLGEDADLVRTELRLTCDLMLAACRVGRALVSAGRRPTADGQGYSVVNLGITNLQPTTKTDLANKLLLLRDAYEQVWLERHLPVGLDHSLLAMSNMLSQFIPKNTNKHVHPLTHNATV